MKTLVESSFPIKSAKLFNCLPHELRSLNGSVEQFKNRLDVFLKTVPDLPMTPNYRQPAASNSIVDQLAHLRAVGVFNP